MPFSPGIAPASGPPSVRQARRGSTAKDSDDWGMVSIVQGRQTDGQHKAQPLISTWNFIRAQLGTRPVQRTPRGDAGQSEGQVSGTGVSRPSSQGDSFMGLFQNGSPEPIHIARFFRAANTGYSGYETIGRSAPGVSGGTGDNFTVLKRPLQRFPTRGPRSVSGANNRKARFDDVGRVPSVFVPTTPLR